MTKRQHFRNFLILLLVVAVGGYWYLTTPDKARLELSQMQGALPKLDQMRPESFPTVKISKIVGWAKGAAPTPAKDLSVKAFAEGLDHPRWLYALPNGDVLVAESTQPARETKGFQDWFERRTMKRANGSTVSANRITLLRDADGDGVAEFRSVLLEGLNSPFGMALYGESLLVANTDEVRKVRR
jgi:glucose/arabinose dehydrogenase